MFTSFVNAPEVADPDLEYLSERGQRRPAGPVLITGPTLTTLTRS